MPEYLVSLNKADVVMSGKKVLHGIDWQIQTTQQWRVDGPNGAGKTTLLKTIAGLIWPVAKTPPSRLYCMNGRSSHLLAGVKQHIGFASYGMQDEYVRGMRNLSSHEVIASGFNQSIMVYDQILPEQQQSIEQLCNSLDLKKPLLAASFLTLSHGQKSAVLFARAIINQPRLLILDEIFNGVDQHRFELMIEMLHQFKQRGGQIVLSWHEHGVCAIEELFTDTLYLHEGRICESVKVEASSSTKPVVIRKINHLVENELKKNDTLIELKNLNVYLGNKPILKNINWTLKKSERWLLTGNNGAGKTTLLKTLLAEVRPSIDSNIWRNGFSSRSSVWQIRRLIGYVSPELQQSYQYNISVFEAVASGFFSSIGLYDDIDHSQRQCVEQQLIKFELQDLANQGVHQLSSGQMRRVLIARAMVLDPDIMIFDEITANLDKASRLSILTAITELAQQGMTMILVGHHHQEIKGLYNRVLNLDNGEIISTQVILNERKDANE